MLIPIGVDVPSDRQPIMNWLIVIGCVAVFGLQITTAAQGEPKALEDFVLEGYTFKGVFGHMWLHGGYMHIIGNMLFLWVFGNAVCSKLGNLLYFPVYLIVGLAAAVAFNTFTDGRAIGASGAVNGIVGMYLVLYPLNDVTMFWMVYARWCGTFSLSSFWMILLWFIYDIHGVVSNGQGVAYTAHIGGFLTGMTIASLLLLTRLIVMDEDEKSLLEVFGVKLPRGKRAKAGSGDWEYIAPESEEEEEIRRLAEKRKQAEHQLMYEENLGVKPASQRYAYQRDDESYEAYLLNKPEEEYIRFSCKCGRKIKVPGKFAGKVGKCPNCSNPVRIPG